MVSPIRVIVACATLTVALLTTPGSISPVLAQSPAAHNRLNPSVEIEGTLEHLHEDSPAGSRDSYFLHTPGGEHLQLNFAGNPPDQLLTGHRIRVKGVRAGHTFTQDPGTNLQLLDLGGTNTSVTTSSTSMTVVPNTFGAQKTLLILVNFQDNPVQPYTAAYASGVMSTVSDFIFENSYGQTWLSWDVAGWYTIPLSSTSCNTTYIATYANSAATTAGVNLAAYARLIYAFPANACPFSGSATVGGSPSRAYINGTFALTYVAHEFGHNLGLQHSHSWACNPNPSGPSNNTIIGDCGFLEYGDGLDIMGWSRAGHFNAAQKERLGWLNYGASPPITTVTASGTYTLAPYETSGSDPKALKVLKITDPTTGVQGFYYVEARQAIGFDSYLGYNVNYCANQIVSSNILNGVAIHWGSTLLDMTPGSIDPYCQNVLLYQTDPALTVGNSFADPDAGVTIATSSAGPSGASVAVTLVTPTCPRANPTVTASPSSQTAPAGTTVSYAISVTNNDGAGCSPITFDLSTSTFGAVGWSMTLDASSCSGAASCMVTLPPLGPGASGTTVMTMTSAVGATGSMGFSVTATNRDDGSYRASVTPMYTVGTSATNTSIGTSATSTSLSVSVATDKPSYTGGQTVSVTAKANSGGSPVSNAAVTFTIRKSNGAVVSQTATTDSTGSAVGKFKLKNQDPPGSYNAGANVSKTPLSGSAATNFTVK